MKSFLEYVSEDMINKFGYDLSRTVVVFPNKRASLFMNECLMRIAGKPIWSPVYITISDLFCQHSALTIADPIKLICELHRSFIKYSGTNESLDHFYGWGQLLLSDFDDIDKNMADAGKVFANLKNIHELDDISYLTEEQKDILKKFFINFNDNSQSELKKRFLSLWQHFGNIYDDFNSRLRDMGIAYEGALYRSVATDEKQTYEYDRYIFVGFNMLHKVEKMLFDRLKKQGKAFFYWDFDKYFMPDSETSHNEAGHYISQYLKYFPNELDCNDSRIYDNLSKFKKIKYINASTETIQARYVSDWLRNGVRMADGSKTAIIMCDESLLQSILYSLPPETGKANITTGYPLSLSPVSSFVMHLLELQLNGRKRKEDRFYQKQVLRVLRHPFMCFISDKAEELASRLSTQKIYYPDGRLLSEDDNLKTLFCDINNNRKYCSPGAHPNLCLLKWVMEIISIAGINSKDTSDALIQESLFRMYMVISRLASLTESGDLSVDVITLRRLIKQLIDSTTIPFHGEPAVGVQIMGILETRNLDFDHVLLLSCNDGKMPKGVNDASFIPYSIRKAYGLTTIDNKISIYSYYFHSILQRATDVTMIYNSSTDNGRGEMSRFMLQLMIESPHAIICENLHAGCNSARSVPHIIEKSPAVMDVLDNMRRISPSAVNQYMRCPLQFFYNYVAKIKEPDNTDEDTVDNRIFGNIFHKAAFYIYKDMAGNDGLIKSGDIDRYLKDPRIIESVVDRVFNEELFKSDNIRKAPEYNGLQIINREVIIGYLRQLMRLDREMTPFKILGLETPAYDTVCFNTSRGEREIEIGGIIDRMDVTGNALEKIRIVDYKTGRQPLKKTNSLDEIFSSDSIEDKHGDYFFQVMIYSLIISTSEEYGKSGKPVSPALFFIRHSMQDRYDPTLTIADEPIDDIRKYAGEFVGKLKDVLGEIFDSQTSFVPTEHKTRCISCPYKSICCI